jgi:hypothetical protein
VPVVPLCKTPEERQFVGTLVAVVMYQSHDQLGLRPVELISITDNQLRQVTALRVDLEVPPWDNPTKISRIKRKYVSRLIDGRRECAKRFELLREVEKGVRRKGATPGKPSLYEPTGILTLIELARQSTTSVPTEAA